MNWIHYSFIFKDHQKTIAALHSDAIKDKPDGIYRELVSYLKKVVDSVLPDLIYRYFYLFQDNPHLFLALELKDKSSIDLVKTRVDQVDMPNFMESMKIDLNTGDEGNGEEALDFFWAGTKFAFLRVSDAYKSGYYNNDEVKILHCFCNQLFVSWDNEAVFYLKCLLHRGAKEVNVQMTNGRNIQAKLDAVRDVS